MRTRIIASETESARIASGGWSVVIAITLDWTADLLVQASTWKGVLGCLLQAQELAQVDGEKKRQLPDPAAAGLTPCRSSRMAHTFGQPENRSEVMLDRRQSLVMMSVMVLMFAAVHTSSTIGGRSQPPAAALSSSCTRRRASTARRQRRQRRRCRRQSQFWRSCSVQRLRHNQSPCPAAVRSPAATSRPARQSLTPAPDNPRRSVKSDMPRLQRCRPAICACPSTASSATSPR
ncbi:hypothetical protein OPT61_g1964 [Boeremia exigua]|uniref:Uncharacterized protein n=1 Tax=Boeremia exigua TaxID=749465 RepID=A0ACC2IN90_9PLEO|nr:hypothetical protein OPT61_g1964 [Boeremia exigua]